MPRREEALDRRIARPGYTFDVAAETPPFPEVPTPELGDLSITPTGVYWIFRGAPPAWQTSGAFQAGMVALLADDFEVPSGWTLLPGQLGGLRKIQKD